MDGKGVLRAEWLAFEHELGFRPKLRGPSHADLVRQDTENGQHLLARFSFPARDNSLKTAWHETASGVRLKSYVPSTYQSDQPLVYFIHGGGFVLGSVDEDDRFVNRHATDTGCVFVSVEYRLAPGHPFPASLEDCLDGAKWCVQHAENLGARKGPIVVMGKSAGGSLAFAVALKLVDERRAGDVQGVVACEPLTVHPDAVPKEFKDRYTAYEENAENTITTKDCMYAFYDLHAAPLDDQYVWPLLHRNLGALPKVYMNACGADTLRDDARLMKELLDQHHVPNQYKEYAKLPHYFFAFPSDHLEELRNEYFSKTAEGIKWIIQTQPTPSL